MAHPVEEEEPPDEEVVGFLRLPLVLVGEGAAAAVVVVEDRHRVGIPRRLPFVADMVAEGLGSVSSLSRSRALHQALHYMVGSGVRSPPRKAVHLSSPPS